MKKLAIAASSVALAAMPVVGVFAASVTTTVDSLTLNVPTGCNIIAAAEGGSDRSDTTAAFGTVALGTTGSDTTSDIVLTCNAAWKLTPAITTALSNGTANIASGTATSGATSNWALKLSSSSQAAGTLSNDFSDFNAVNGTNKVSDTAADTSYTVSPTYRVYVAPGQATGEYSGSVTYTVALNSGS